jgi:non-ribosomal peptide synthetase-like protein
MARKGLSQMSLMTADVIRLLVDLLLYAGALLPAGFAFVELWRGGTLPERVLAFPAAYVGLIVGFWASIWILRALLIRRIMPGTYSLGEPRAVRWIIADSFIRLVQRSFLRGYIDDFAPMRYLFYRSLGAKIDRTFFFGWDAKITDPWSLSVGRNVIIGSFVVILGHSVERDQVILDRVEIGDGATVGVRSVIMPGAQIGANAIVGACSLVLKGTKIPPGEIWAGVPARKIGGDAAASAKQV